MNNTINNLKTFCISHEYISYLDKLNLKIIGSGASKKKFPDHWLNDASGTNISKKNPRSLLPNTLTIFGVCLGLSSIKFALDINYAMAIIAIGFAAILDTLDGRVARLIKATSKVGKELDSLTDVISFGVAPSFVMYFWTINEIGKLGWMLVLIYTVCCALRLARFNLTVVEETEAWKINFFEGVPSPAAAGLILLPLILNLSDLVQFENTAIISSIVILMVSILMVSKIPTYSLKRILIPRHLTIFLLLGIGIYLSLLIFYIFKTLFFSGLIYILLIPISYLHYRYINKKSMTIVTEEETEDVL